MNLSWVTPVANEPTRLVASVESSSRTATNLVAGSPFSISLLTLDQRELGRAFVKPQLTWTNEDKIEYAQGHAVLRSKLGVPWLSSSVGVLAGTSELIRELGEHALWLLSVDEIAGRPEVLEGPASRHDVRVLGVHDTRMNYGR